MKNLLLGLSILISTIAFAQSDFEGKITYKMTYENLGEEMKQMQSMLPKTSTVEIKNGISKYVTPNGMGGETTVLNDMKSGEMIMLMNMMGNKIATKSNINDEEQELPEIEKSAETKKILEYDCKKAIAKLDGMEIEIFYTDELPNVAIGGTSYGIDGFPMEIIMNQEMFTMIQTVAEINKEGIELIKMEVPEGYKTMTKKEIQELIGQGM